MGLIEQVGENLAFEKGYLLRLFHVFQPILI